MKNILNYFIDNIYKIAVIYFIAQLLLVIIWRVPFTSDSLYYYKLAQDCLKYHCIYPAKIYIFQDYIIAPLYINLIIMILSIYNSSITIGILNIFLNALQMYLFFKLSRIFFDERTSRTGLLLYMFYLNTLGMVLMNLTEFLFGVLILIALIFFYKNTVKSFFLSGVFTAASIAVRPLGWGLLIAFMIIFILKFIKKEKILHAFFAAALGVSLFIIAGGTITKIYSGDFIFTSTNGPVNLIIGANDNATGAYNAKVFDKGNTGYIDTTTLMTYKEKESYWQKQALNWISVHPLKWLSLIPRKIFFMFAWSDFTIPYLSHINGLNVPRFVKMLFLGKLSQAFAGIPFYLALIYILLLILNYIYYFYIMLIFLFNLIKIKVSWILSSKFLPVILFILSGVSITLVTFGDARFNYPYLLFIILFVSQPLSRYLSGSKLLLTKTHSHD